MPHRPKPKPPAAGAAIQGRPDLTQAVVAPPSRQYGERVASERAQRAAPLPQAPPPPQPQQPGPVLSMPAPPPFDGPTQFPDQPVTAGLPVGPGPGPEVLGLPDPAAAELASLVPYLPGLELMADLPGASISTRNLVRRIRGALPPEMRRQ